MSHSIGPQKATPVSLARLKAQQRQIEKQLLDVENKVNNEHRNSCSCGYQLIRRDRYSFCSKCFRSYQY